ncbi:hypothetical protein CEXT_160731 [Caerostris extrusa]|uniref:Uncharacterized protein n=1 Tax=Caerostris extrusa TaxID=172846 RepID=A0AAV4M800_CAEEX|nr:hypothetical protein CEXT_160731 [Caerostris extrusa]
MDSIVVATPLPHISFRNKWHTLFALTQINKNLIQLHINKNLIHENSPTEKKKRNSLGSSIVEIFVPQQPAVGRKETETDGTEKEEEKTPSQRRNRKRSTAVCALLLF